MAQLDGKKSKVIRPWGWYENLSSGAGYLIKKLYVVAGQRLSLQLHNHRSEHWIIIRGVGIIELDGESKPIKAHDHIIIPVGTSHRVTATEQDLVILELQEGEMLAEEDIIRLEDDYGRK